MQGQDMATAHVGREPPTIEHWRVARVGRREKKEEAQREELKQKVEERQGQDGKGMIKAKPQTRAVALAMARKQTGFTNHEQQEGDPFIRHHIHDHHLQHHCNHQTPSWRLSNAPTVRGTDTHSTLPIQTMQQECEGLGKRWTQPLSLLAPRGQHIPPILDPLLLDPPTLAPRAPTTAHWCMQHQHQQRAHHKNGTFQRFWGDLSTAHTHTQSHTDTHTHICTYAHKYAYLCTQVWISSVCLSTELDRKSGLSLLLEDISTVAKLFRTQLKDIPKRDLHQGEGSAHRMCTQKDGTNPCFTHVLAPLPIHTNVHTHTQTHTHTHTHTYDRTHSHAFITGYIHTSTSTHTHAYTGSAHTSRDGGAATNKTTGRTHTRTSVPTQISTHTRREFTQIRGYTHKRERERETVCVCVCLCVCLRERKKRERESERRPEPRTRPLLPDSGNRI